MNASAVLLQIERSKVEGQIRLPVDRLAVIGIKPAAAERYARSHIAAVGADGRAWRGALAGAHVARIDNVRDVVIDVTITPPDGKVTDFDLRYDAIVQRLVTHKAIATVSKDGSAPRTLGVFDWDTKSLRVDAHGASWLSGLLAAACLGVQHITGGADHLLFLLMLLIPAPLVARRGRWRRSDGPRRSAIRVVHVVSAFALGHSLTLALASF